MQSSLLSVLGYGECEMIKPITGTFVFSHLWVLHFVGGNYVVFPPPLHTTAAS